MPSSGKALGSVPSTGIKRRKSSHKSHSLGHCFEKPPHDNGEPLSWTEVVAEASGDLRGLVPHTELVGWRDGRGPSCTLLERR